MIFGGFLVFWGSKVVAKHQPLQQEVGKESSPCSDSANPVLIEGGAPAPPPKGAVAGWLCRRARRRRPVVLQAISLVVSEIRMQKIRLGLGCNPKIGPQGLGL